MSRTEQVRQWFTAPANMGAERTAAELAAALKIGPESNFSSTLHGLYAAGELLRERNDAGASVYRWNEKSRKPRAVSGKRKKSVSGKRPAASGKTAPCNGVDADLLRQVVAGACTFLAQARLRPAPLQMAELIVLLYSHFTEQR